jgi:AraC family transcriptional regulator
MLRQSDLLPILRYLLDGSCGDASLNGLARRSGWSRFHFHRAFRRFVGETPRQYTQRLRLERAAAALLATDDSIRAISRTVGFRSHEVFTRAFLRQFGRTPLQYRIGARSGAARRILLRHRKIVESAGPCIRLHHLATTHSPGRFAMSLLSIERREIAPMPFLFARRQCSRKEISNTLAECFGLVFPHCLKAGLQMAGFPLARYPVIGPLMTIEGGVPLVTPATPEEGMEYCVLPGGPVVFAIHGGPYDQLEDTHAAILRWMQDQKLRVAAGGHWEWYVTDPGEHPDPKDWRTHIYYPLEK